MSDFARLIRDAFGARAGPRPFFGRGWSSGLGGGDAGPVGSWATNWVIGRTGRYAIANEDIVRFALSPRVRALLFAGTVAILGVALAHARLSAWHDTASQPDAGSGQLGDAPRCGSSAPVLAAA